MIIEALKDILPCVFLLIWANIFFFFKRNPEIRNSDWIEGIYLFFFPWILFLILGSGLWISTIWISASTHQLGDIVLGATVLIIFLRAVLLEAKIQMASLKLTFGEVPKRSLLIRFAAFGVSLLIMIGIGIKFALR